MMLKICLLLASGLNLSALSQCLAQAAFTPLERAVTNAPFFVWAMSGDGSTVAGQSGFVNPGEVTEQPARWAGVTHLLPDLRIPPYWESRGVARGVSHDGSVIVGASLNATDPTYRATLWLNGFPSELPIAPGAPTEGSFAHDVSADGTVVIGLSFQDAFAYRAHRWVNGKPTVIPGTPGRPYDFPMNVSADGSVVAGYSTQHLAMGGQGTGWVWNNGITTPLQTPSGAFGVRIEGISDDGEVVLGQVNMASGGGVHWLSAVWREGVPLMLPHPAGPSPEVWALDISGDGTKVVGGTSGGLAQEAFAFIWDESSGMVNLNDLLPTLGVDLQGWHLRYVEAISSDGLTLTGVGRDRLGNVNSWIAVIPAPGHAMVVFSTWWLGLRRRRSVYLPTPNVA